MVTDALFSREFLGEWLARKVTDYDARTRIAHCELISGASTPHFGYRFWKQAVGRSFPEVLVFARKIGNQVHIDLSQEARVRGLNLSRLGVPEATGEWFRTHIPSTSWGLFLDRWERYLHAKT